MYFWTDNGKTEMIPPCKYFSLLIKHLYNRIVETLFPVKLLCNDSIIKSAIQIIFNWIKL